MKKDPKTGTITSNNPDEVWCLMNFEELLRRMSDRLPRVPRRCMYHMKTNGDCFVFDHRIDKATGKAIGWVKVCNQERPMPKKKRFTL